jgi:hypothetical protein
MFIFSQNTIDIVRVTIIWIIAQKFVSLVSTIMSFPEQLLSFLKSQHEFKASIGNATKKILFYPYFSYHLQLPLS